MSETEEQQSPNHLVSWWMPAAAAWLLLLAACGAYFARRWPLVHDAPLLHYIVFLMGHGMAPYRDIVDMNLPGSYMSEWLVMHTLGGGQHGWFAWDLLTGAMGILACSWIAGRGRRAAGIAAGALAYLLHLRDGPANLGQRDWLVAVMLLLAFACLFQSIRDSKPQWLFGFGLFSMAAATIKPPVAMVWLLVLAVLSWRRRSTGETIPCAFLYAAGGVSLPLLAVAIFLTRWHVWAPFIHTVRGLIPWYAGLQIDRPLHLLLHLFPESVWPLACAGAFLCWKNKSWRLWESQLLLSGVAAGALMYFVQRKGWIYHRYTALAFVLLWVLFEVHLALEVLEKSGLEKLRRRRWPAIATLAFATVVLAPVFLHSEKNKRYPQGTLDHLRADLAQLGGPKLSGHIQCLDMTLGGCITTLYRDKLVQSTGYIYDFYLFPAHGNAVTSSLQKKFLAKMTAAPPAVIVLSSQIWPGDTYSYAELVNWPAFKNFLEQTYILRKEQPMLADDLAGYRIYTLKQATD